MKRLAITGADRDPSGAFYLIESSVAAAGGVVVGESIVVFLVDDTLEADAIVEFVPGWGSGWFARAVGEWRDASGE